MRCLIVRRSCVKTFKFIGKIRIFSIKMKLTDLFDT